MRSLKLTKRYMIIIAMLMTLSIGGCNTEDITPEQMQNYGSGLESITEQIKIYQQLIVNYTNLLKETGALDANDVTAVNNLIAQADKVTPELQKLAQSLKDGTYSDSTGLITLLEGLQVANRSTSSFNKYWPAIDAILVIAVALLTWIAKKKASEVKVVTEEKDLATSTLKNVVTSVESVSTSAYDEVTDVVKTLNTKEQTNLITSLKPEVPAGFEINKVETPTTTKSL